MMEQKRSIEEDIKIIEQKTGSHIGETVDRYKNLESVLFAKSATYLQPWLIPSNVESAMRELEGKSAQLEDQIKAINELREQKLGSGALDMLAFERKEFVKRVSSARD